MTGTSPLAAALVLCIVAGHSPAYAELMEGDCATTAPAAGSAPKVVPLPSDKALGCDSGEFWNRKEYANPPDPASKTDLPVCMGFSTDINKYIAAQTPARCRRLAMVNYSQGKNMRFVECLAQGQISGGKVMWVTKPTAVSKAKKGWNTFVTPKEMCLYHRLKGSFLRKGVVGTVCSLADKAKCAVQKAVGGGSKSSSSSSSSTSSTSSSSTSSTK